MYKQVENTHYKQEFNATALSECWRECMATCSYSERKSAVGKFNTENSWKKRGMAVIPLKYPVGFGSVAMGQVSPSNTCGNVTWRKPEETGVLRKLPLVELAI